MKPVSGPLLDIHCHIGPPLLAEEMLRLMDNVGVDQAVVFPTPYAWTLPSSENYYNTNDYVADSVRKYPERMIGFACINPAQVGNQALGMPNLARNELHRCIRDLDLRGVKLHPENHCFAVDTLCAGGGLSWFMETIIELQRETGRKIPILSHGMTTLGAQPDQFARVANDYPEVNIVIAHGAGFQNLYFAGLGQAKKCPNLYYDTAMLTADDAYLLGVVKQVGIDKIIFGSDHFTRAHTNLYGNFLYVLQRAFPDKFDLERVLGGNLARLL
ncbi:MAG: hypothetical protein E4H01_13820 [Lysobacterales bacterium]|nr:MAG: hypothetical protein E4H01_13820 [Xanthomonadales bacterium]